MTGASLCKSDATAPEDTSAAVLSRRGVPERPELARGTGLIVLTKRADFVRASHALRAGTKGLNLQGRLRTGDQASATLRVGFTCSKKVGNAVARNRAKRRLRAAAREVLPQMGRAGWDYVLIGKNGSTDERPYDALLADLRAALARVHAQAEK